MFAKSALLCALVTASAQIALAQPYCLLTAVNKFEHPADQKTLCCTDASQVKSYIGDLCPAAAKSDALTAFKTTCEEAGYGSCSSSSSSSTSSSASATSNAQSTASGSGSASASATATGSVAPYPIVYTSTYFDEVCSCTKTAAISSTGVAGSTGFATGTAPIATGTSGAATGSGVAGAGSGSGAAATGSPIAPATPSKTGSAGSAGFTGAATKNFGSVAAGLIAVAGIAVAL